MEILVAMAVLAIALATLFRLQSSTIALSEAARFKAEAPVLAQQQMAALAAAGWDPSKLPQGFEGAYASWTWDCEVTESDGELADFLGDGAGKDFKQIRLRIISPGREREYSLGTWRYSREE